MSFDGNPNDPSQQQPGQQPGYPISPAAEPGYSNQEYVLPGAEYPSATWQQPVSGAPGFTAAPPPEPENKMRNVWLHPAVIVGVLGTIVILMVAVTLLALRSPTQTADAAESGTGDDTQTQDSTGSEEDDGTGSGSGSGSDQPSDEGKSTPTGDEVFFSGQMEVWMSAYAENSIDFDTGSQAANGDEEDPKASDAMVHDNGIDHMNKNTFGEWGDGDAPTTAAECDGLADDLKSDSIHVSRLEQGAVFCFTTAEKRSGYFTVDAVELAENGSLDTLDFTFTVWKGKDDM